MPWSIKLKLGTCIFGSNNDPEIASLQPTVGEDGVRRRQHVELDRALFIELDLSLGDFRFKRSVGLLGTVVGFFGLCALYAFLKIFNIL